MPLLRCWWSSGDAGAGAVNYREKALLGWGGGGEKPPLKGSSSFSPALEGAAVHFDEGKAPKLEER